MFETDSHRFDEFSSSRHEKGPLLGDPILKSDFGFVLNYCRYCTIRRSCWTQYFLLYSETILGYLDPLGYHPTWVDSGQNRPPRPRPRPFGIPLLGPFQIPSCDFLASESLEYLFGIPWESALDFPLGWAVFLGLDLSDLPVNWISLDLFCHEVSPLDSAQVRQSLGRRNESRWPGVALRAAPAGGRPTERQKLAFQRLVAGSWGLQLGGTQMMYVCVYIYIYLHLCVYL